MEELKLLPKSSENEHIEGDIVKIPLKKETVSNFEKTAKIFEKSAQELESEFINYKIEKMQSKIDYLLEDVTNDIDLKEKIILAKRNGLSSVTVLPTKISSAQKFIKDKKLDINTLIAYPYGEEFFKVKVLSAKLSSKMEIACVMTPITPSMLNYYKIKNTEKELAKIKKAVGKRNVKIIIDVEKFTDATLTLLVKLLINVKINTIVVKLNGTDLTLVKKLSELSSDKINIEAMGDFELNLGIKLFNLGCKKLSVINAEKFCNQLVDSLKA